ncbi:MAG: hypothetical protein P4L69_04695 [Desulfosporosinus sp.]|nr:hypothetical protein [Desulfosporosinus sp.]
MKSVVIQLKPIEWKIIPDTLSCKDTHFSASSLGSIRNDLTETLLESKQNSGGYVEVSGVGLPTSLVHRLVAMAFHENPWNLPLVDHKNRIRHDNRACNLEWANNNSNMLNRPKKKNAKSIYYGVMPIWNKWKAYLSVDGKRVNLGSFESELEAGQAYNEYVIANNLKNKLNIL